MALMVVFGDGTEKSHADCWKELNCTDNDALAVAQNVTMAGNTEKTIALLIREERSVRRPLHDLLIEATGSPKAIEIYEVKLPSKNKKDIEAAKVEAVRAFIGLACNELRANFVGRPALPSTL